VTPSPRITPVKSGFWSASPDFIAFAARKIRPSREFSRSSQNCTAAGRRPSDMVTSSAQCKELVQLG